MRYAILGLLTMSLLVGCATSGPSQYQLYSETQKAIAQAHAVAETARYNALLEIAKNGDSAAKVAAVLSLQMGSGGGAARQSPMITPPESTSDTMLRWAGVLLPTVTQSLGIAANVYAANTQKQIAITQSNNAAATAASTNNAFTAMSNNMATSNTNIAKAGFDSLGTANSTITSVSNAGITGVANTAKAGFDSLGAANNAIVNVSTAGITGVSTTAAAGLTAATNISTSAGNQMTAIAKAGMDTSAALVKDTNSVIIGLGTQNQANINNVSSGFKSALDSAIAKLTGTTTTTTTTTSNTNNTTTTNNVACPAGQTFTGGACKSN